MTTDVVVVGVHGHGQSHLRRLRSADPAHVRLVGVCEPRPLSDALRAAVGDVPVRATLGDVLSETRPDITIVCTPIHTHVDLALEALHAGSDVLLEKPPASTLADHERLIAGVAASGRRCQVAFQSLGSHALPAVDRLLREDAIGAVRGIGGAGTWMRDASYYARSRWAGRRELDGVPVVDGAVTNPFAHAMATALRIDGSDRAGQIDRVETELHHAHDIEADDTSSVRVITARGTTITVAVTLCAAATADPYLIIHGTRGRITLFYTRDDVHIQTVAGTVVEHHGRTDLLDDLIARRDGTGGEPLVSPERTTGFMEFMDAVRLAPDPVAIPAAYLRIDAPGPTERRIITGVDETIHASAEQLLLFSELGAPWARTRDAASGEVRR